MSSALAHLQPNMKYKEHLEGVEGELSVQKKKFEKTLSECRSALQSFESVKKKR